MPAFNKGMKHTVLDQEREGYHAGVSSLESGSKILNCLVQRPEFFSAGEFPILPNTIPTAAAAPPCILLSNK